MHGSQIGSRMRRITIRRRGMSNDRADSQAATRTMYCSGEGGTVTGVFQHHPRYGWVHMTNPPHTVMGSPLGGTSETPVPMVVRNDCRAAIPGVATGSFRAAEV
jgi:hypothetical protein